MGYYQVVNNDVNTYWAIAQNRYKVMDVKTASVCVLSKVNLNWETSRRLCINKYENACTNLISSVCKCNTLYMFNSIRLCIHLSLISNKVIPQ